MLQKDLIYRWDPEKNKWLNDNRHISFETVVEIIRSGMEVADYPHPNVKRHPNQRISVVVVKNYAYIIPYIKTKGTVFLKTVIPSRKATKKYIKQQKKKYERL